MGWDDEDADWDAQNDNAVADSGLTDKWDGEDEDDDTLLGDDWDAEPKKEEAKPVVQGEKKLTKRQLAKKKDEEEKAARLARIEHAKALASDPRLAALSKAEQKRAQEEADHRLTEDLFGGEGYERPEGGEFKNEQLDQDNVDMAGDASALAELANLKLKSEPAIEETPLKTNDDFKKFAAKVAGMVTKKNNTKQTLEFLQTLITDVTKTMKLDDCNVVKKKITVICTEKQKAEKGKKKGGAKKGASLTMSKRDDAFDDYGHDDGGMYDDFM